MQRPRVEGIEPLRPYLDSRRGLMISAMHHGHWDTSLAGAGLRPHIIAHRNWFEQTSPYWMKRALRVSAREYEFVNVAEGSGEILRRLDAGATVMLTLDVPGHSPATFAGRRVLGSAGAARLAAKAGVPVLTLTHHRDEQGRPFVRLGEPLEPADFGSVEELLAELIRRHEETILDWPEALQWPVRRWHFVDEEDRQRYTLPSGGWVI
jgi:lauroyl/myristoyl acyltransferase